MRQNTESVLGYWVGAYRSTELWTSYRGTSLSWARGSWFSYPAPRNSDATLEAAEERYQAWRERRAVRTVRLTLGTPVAA